VAIPGFSDNVLKTIQAAECPASPEEIFLTWLLRLPDGVDASEAAAAEVVRLDQRFLRSLRGKRLRELFVAAAKAAPAKRLLSQPESWRKQDD
jgi:hypothetical protein